MFRKRISNSVQLLVLKIGFCALLLYEVNGIPINFANNRNSNYNENHANRPLLPNQSPQLQNRPPHPQQTPGQNKGPEIEDFARLHTSQNQFRRHAIIPPDGKLTPGATFHHQNPPEQFGKSKSNFHQMHEESLPNHIFRQQPPPQYEGQADNRQPHHNSFHRRHTHRQPHPQDIPQSSQHSPRYNNNIFQRDEPYETHGVDFSSDSHIYTNEIFREKSSPPNYFDNHVNPFPAHQTANIPLAQQQLVHSNDVFAPNVFLNQENNRIYPGKPNSAPPPPTAVSVIVQTAHGNSTLFIEYDVSDRDNTYETTMEVDDGRSEI